MKPNPARIKATKARKVTPAKTEATDGSASKAALGETAPPVALAKPDVKKIQAMLRSKMTDGVTFGCRMDFLSLIRILVRITAVFFPTENANNPLLVHPNGKARTSLFCVPANQVTHFIGRIYEILV